MDLALLNRHRKPISNKRKKNVVNVEPQILCEYLMGGMGNGRNSSWIQGKKITLRTAE